MQDYIIMTDSCCDLTDQMARELELEVLPLSLNMEDRVYHNYLDGREIGFQDFYARLRAGALATTSAISVGVFDEAMRKILDSGRDVLYLAFSSALWGAWSVAIISMEPSLIPSIIPSLSFSVRSGGFIFAMAPCSSTALSVRVK